MVRKYLLALLVGFACLTPAPLLSPAYGQDAGQKTFSTEQLDQMLAPVALYPDEVLANVLMASTYPLDVVQAARWRAEPSNKKLKGDALAKALEGKAWDPSIKALTLFPEVLDLMSAQLEWTQSLGDAFLAQEDELFARVQYLRQKAEAAGNLKSNKQQTVKKQSNPQTQVEYIVIEPAKPEYVYIPVYQPTVVYGTWWYPSYPPYSWNWYPGASFVNGMFWGAGFAIANDIWGWNRFDWNGGNIDIDVNRYNDININRTAISNNVWQHNPTNRGPVPYRDKATREKFAKDTKVRDKSKDFSGFDRDTMDKTRDADRIKEKLGESSGGKMKDRAKDVDRDRADALAGDRGGQLKDKKPDRGGDKVKDRPADRPKTKDVKPPKASRDVRKPSAKPAASALDVKPKAQVQKQVDRGAASRAAARSHPAARGGGGGSRGGGRGGRR